MYSFLFRACRIKDVFWPHTTYSTTHGYGQVHYHAYPLFPVQKPSGTESKSNHRDLLASFTGAYDPRYYLTPVRKWIDQCAWDSASDNTYIKITSEWHFEKTVYQEQVAGMPLSTGEKEAANIREQKFRELLQRSIFSLCPSGSGPNSIRLWESIGFGSIPVLLADGLKLPARIGWEEDSGYWSNGILIVSEQEKAVAKLPSLLKELANDSAFIRRQRASLSQIWDHYWTDCFARPITDFLTDHDLGGSTSIQAYKEGSRRSFVKELHTHFVHFLRYASRNPMLNQKWPTGFTAIVDYIVEQKTGIRHEAVNINTMFVERCKQSKGRNSYLVLGDILQALVGES
ncbi:exostosin family protein [Synechococcus sp. J7-Johnson]|nr:exostosin family protein [Synechococcus sp. J7-Johnson]